MSIGHFLLEVVRLFMEAMLAPVFYCALGAVADHYLKFDSRSLSQLTVYVFLPPLMFTTLMEANVQSSEVFRLAAFILLMLIGMALAGLLYARALKMDAGTTSSATLATTFFNGVNLGFPVVLYSFGDQGLVLAGVLVAVNGIPHNVSGLLIAARGTLSTRDTIRALFRMPFLYTMGLALCFRLTAVQLPAALSHPIAALGKAAIPMALVAVGMELRRIQTRAISREVFGTVALRLLLAPMLAWFVSDWVGLTGLLRNVAIVQASMPSAIMPIVYARLFGGNVEFISRAVFYSTLGGVISIPVLLAFLK